MIRRITAVLILLLLLLSASCENGTGDAEGSVVNGTSRGGESVVNGETDISVPIGKAIVMNGTKTLKSDKKRFELINYQNLTEALSVGGTKKKAAFGEAADQVAAITYLADVVTAPGGYTYAVYHNIETEDGSDTTFDVFVADESGWKKCGTCVTTPSTAKWVDEGRAYIYHPSLIGIAADDASNAYIFSYSGGKVVASVYDLSADSFTVSADVIPMNMKTEYQKISAYYDRSAGNRGSIVVMCRNNADLEFYRFDIETGRFTDDFEFWYARSVKSVYYFCVHDGDIILVWETARNGDLCWCIIKDAFTEKSEVTEACLHKSTQHFEGSVSVGENVSLENCWGGVAFDGQGNTHIIVQYSNTEYSAHGRNDSIFLRYYLVGKDGSFEYYDLDDKLFGNAANEPYCGGVFIRDGECCYIEKKRIVPHTIALCRIKDGKSELIDMIDIPNNVEYIQMRSNGTDVIFQTETPDKAFWYFQIRFPDQK